MRGKRMSVLAVLGLLAALIPLGAAPAGAAAAELFFSEYIEGSSNNKALEIYNGTGAAVDLSADGYSIQMFFNGAATASLTINLTGTVADGDVHVVAHASASQTILDLADQTNGSGWFNGDDAVVLRKGTTIVDVIGEIGSDPGAEWGTGDTSTANNTLRRKATLCGGDTDGSNAFDPSIEWDGFATDTFDGLGAHSAACGGADTAPTVASTFPVDGATDMPVGADLTVTFSEPVDATGSWFTLTCASGAKTAVASGGPTTFAIDPDAPLPDGEACTLTIVAANVTDQDTNDPPNNMAADVTVAFTPLDACAAPITPIYDIQGSGAAAAITGPVTTRGVVVSDHEGPSPALRGFYLQDATGDADPATSDGIFVFNGNNNDVSAGDLVTVTGNAGEFGGQTQIGSVSSIVACGTGSVDPTPVTLPFDTVDFPERYEGMLVEMSQTLVISEYFNYDRFGEVVLALPSAGLDRAATPTAVVEPGLAAQELAALNARSRITVDDRSTAQNPSVSIHPGNGAEFTLTNRFRGGDTITAIQGVLGFGFSLYRIQPTVYGDYVAGNPRTGQPDDVGGSLTVTAFNVLNYFTTLDNAGSICGPLGNQGCRGADNAVEFTRQRDKIISAMQAIDSDVVGLMEIENHAADVPAADLVAGLNDAMGAGTYDYVETGAIGTDAIRLALIYKPASVSPVGPYAVLDSSVDPRFLDTFNRPVLAQTFEENATGARFTVAVNHLKSKGSDCDDIGDPDTGDGQGNCNLTREAAAEALVDWLATDPTASGDADFLIIGDLNSYDKEDPIDAILAGSDDVAESSDDYTDLLARFGGEAAYSYVFDGQNGYLDYAIASATLNGQVTGATAWHINADEPDLLDYDTSFKPPAQDALYEPNAYRSSDHDPVIVGLNLVAHDFAGFFRPLDNPPAVNRVKAGQAVPIKFSLGGFFGLDVLAAGSPVWVDCGSPEFDGEGVLALGTGGLTYDARADQYVFVAATAKAWAGQCRQLVVVLDDGSIHRAIVEFR